MDNSLLVRVFLIVIASATLFVLVHRYSNRKTIVDSEKFFETLSSKPYVEQASADVAKPSQVQPSDYPKDEDYKAVDFDGQEQVASCFPKDKLSADDLLPKDAANSKWAELNPAGQGDVKDINFLQAGHHVGLNTTQGCNRLASHQIRSTPANPRQVVSPWLISTYDGSCSRKPLEIGGDCE
jgi:hypothetical protein